MQEDIDGLSRELNVSTSRLAQWRDDFLAAGQAGLMSREPDARDEEIQRLRAKIAVPAEGTEDVVRALEEQAPHEAVAGLRHVQLGIALARLPPARSQAEVRPDVAAPGEAPRAPDREHEGESGDRFGIARGVDDGVIAIAAGILLFVLPSHERRGERLLEWRETARLPWGMLLVFGGGFALATGFQTSGLSLWLGGRLAALHGIPPFALMLIVCVAITFLTEFASNTAATQMVLPVLAAAATAAGTDPRYLMIPATLAASCGFMMPVGSPTQTIVFGTGLVPMRDMVRAGFWFDLLGIALVAALFGLLAGPLMGIDAGVLPTWAKP